jgi:RNA polymerase sigma factor for flagellar operon FliA
MSNPPRRSVSGAVGISVLQGGEDVKDPRPEGLWEQYRAAPTTELRDEIFELYWPLVTYAARRSAASMPHAEVAVLESHGALGLLQGIETFDVSRGFKAETFLVHRIRGAILDALRDEDFAPRTVRTQSKKLEVARYALMGELCRDPTEAELAAKLGLTVDQLRAHYAEAGNLVVESLSYSSEEGDLTVGDRLVSRAENPEDAYELVEYKNSLAAAICTLPERSYVIFVLHYLEGLSMGDIARVLNITESRTSQIHVRAIVELRQNLLVQNGAKVSL